MINIDKDFMKELVIFDSHCDTVNVLLNQPSYFVKTKNSHLDISKIKIGGLKAQIFAIWVNHVYSPYRTIKKALLLYNTLEKNIFTPGYGVKVTSTSEMDFALKNNKLACWLSLEGGHIIENSIDILEFFYSIGVRCMTLTHFKNTDWADSSGDKPKWDGLNSLGKKIIKKMDELGMAIDVSHSSDKTVEDVLDIAEKPIMASHSCARAICDIPRNIPDSLIKDIAERNGYIGINFFPGFLNKRINKQVDKNMKKYKSEYEEKIKGNEDNPDIINLATLDLFSKIAIGNDKIDLNVIIDHIEHMADIGGIDCVGLGSDFDGIPSTPTDLTDVSCYPNLVSGLYERGFNKKDIQKIMGGNLYNYFKNFSR